MGRILLKRGPLWRRVLAAVLAGCVFVSSSPPPCAAAAQAQEPAPQRGKVARVFLRALEPLKAWRRSAVPPPAGVGSPRTLAEGSAPAERQLEPSGDEKEAPGLKQAGALAQNLLAAGPDAGRARQELDQSFERSRPQAPPSETADSPAPFLADHNRPSAWHYDPASKVLRMGGREALPLGNGHFKRVYVPADQSGLVVKIYDSRSFHRWISAVVSVLETRFALRLERAGLGPRLMAAGAIPNGFRYQVMERVHGETLEKLMLQGPAADSAVRLTRRLLADIEARGILVSDLDATNIMVGTTESNSVPRAYIVDAVWLHQNRLLAFAFETVAGLVRKSLGLVTTDVRETLGKAEAPPQKTSAQPEGRRPSRASRAFLAGGLALLGALLWRSDLAALADEFVKAGWRVPFAALPFFVVTLSETLGWWLVIPKPRGRLRFLELLGLNVGSGAIDEVTPAYLLMGEAAKAHMLGRKGIETAPAMASVFISKISSIFAQVLFLAVGMALISYYVPAARAVMPLAWAGLAATGVALAGLVLGQRNHGLFRLVHKLGLKVRFLRKWAERFEGVLLKTDDLVNTYWSGRHKEFWLSIAANFWKWFGEAFEAWVLLAILGLPASFTTAIILQTLLCIAGGLTGFVPGGVGTMEASTVAIFSWLGIAPAPALAFAMLRRLRQAVWTAVGLAVIGRVAGATPRREDAGSPGS